MSEACWNENVIFPGVETFFDLLLENFRNFYSSFHPLLFTLVSSKILCFDKPVNLTKSALKIIAKLNSLSRSQMLMTKDSRPNMTTEWITSDKFFSSFFFWLRLYENVHLFSCITSLLVLSRKIYCTMAKRNRKVQVTCQNWV